jgi:hypothetical protein
MGVNHFFHLPKLWFMPMVSARYWLLNIAASSSWYRRVEDWYLAGMRYKSYTLVGWLLESTTDNLRFFADSLSRRLSVFFWNNWNRRFFDSEGEKKKNKKREKNPKPHTTKDQHRFIDSLIHWFIHDHFSVTKMHTQSSTLTTTTQLHNSLPWAAAAAAMAYILLWQLLLLLRLLLPLFTNSMCNLT